MTTMLDLISARATEYCRSQVPVAIAAAHAIEDALAEGKTTYPDLYRIVQELAPLFGYSSYLVPLDTGRVTYHELKDMAGRLTPDYFVGITNCMRLLVRVDTIRNLLRAEHHKPRTPGGTLMTFDVAGRMSLREIGLWCTRDSRQLELVLRKKLDTGELTYELLYGELYAAVQTSTLNSVVFRPQTDREEMLRYAMAGCRPSNHNLLVEIALCALQIYTTLTFSWDREDYFRPTTRPWYR